MRQEFEEEADEERLHSGADQAMGEFEGRWFVKAGKEAVAAALKEEGLAALAGATRAAVARDQVVRKTGFVTASRVACHPSTHSDKPAHMRAWTLPTWEATRTHAAPTGTLGTQTHARHGHAHIKRHDEGQSYHATPDPLCLS